MKCITCKSEMICYDDVNDAIRNAKQHAAATDMIIVCGSVFLVGEVEIPAND